MFIGTKKIILLLALFNDKKLFVMHFMFDVIFLGFNAILGRVLELLLQFWKLYGNLGGPRAPCGRGQDESAIV